MGELHKHLQTRVLALTSAVHTTGERQSIQSSKMCVWMIVQLDSSLLSASIWKKINDFHPQKIQSYISNVVTQGIYFKAMQDDYRRHLMIWEHGEACNGTNSSKVPSSISIMTLLVYFSLQINGFQTSESPEWVSQNEEFVKTWVL